MAADDDGGVFDVAKWEPDIQEYGLFYLLMCRSQLPDNAPKPCEIETLKYVESRRIATACSPQASEDEEDATEDPRISEGEPAEDTEAVPWPKRSGAWWRIHPNLGEDVLVREGVSLTSPELRRCSPGDLVQQAGPPRIFASGRAKGCIRLPVLPCGWITADASRAGGPQYVAKATAPRWKVCFSAPSGQGKGDVPVRGEPAPDGAEVEVLYKGDIVVQAGPALTMLDGVVVVPIGPAILRRGGNDDSDDERGGAGSSAKVLGWVTVDAAPKGGPLFLKPVSDPDGSKRRRRKNGAR